jgi:hypothetical protein
MNGASAAQDGTSGVAVPSTDRTCLQSRAHLCMLQWDFVTLQGEAAALTTAPCDVQRPKVGGRSGAAQGCAIRLLRIMAAASGVNSRDVSPKRAFYLVLRTRAVRCGVRRVWRAACSDGSFQKRVCVLYVVI